MPAPKSAVPAAKTTSTAKTTAAPAKTPVTAPSKTAAKTAAPKTTAAPAKTAAKAPAKAAPAPAKTAAKAPVKEATAKKPEAAKSIAPEVARNRRDPFISPIRLQEDRMKSNPACTTGARCLVISQVVLKGVVKTQNGWIAMVENAAKKQYNLHEKDAVQNGVVTKITGDSIVFTETVTDPLGRPVSREVVKRVTAPVV
jgi:Tfp pilus assembly protein PilP